MVIEVSDFEREVLEQSHETPVLVDFWAPWCGPCRQLGPVLERLADENEGNWKLAKLNTDENQGIAREYRISSIPAVKLFVDGQVVDEFIGALPEQQVRNWLDNAVPNETRRRVEEIKGLLASGEESQAESLLRSLLEEDPANAAARVLTARLIVLREPERASELARNAVDDADLMRVRDAVQTVVRLLGDKQTGALPEGAGKQSYTEGLEAVTAGDIDTALGKFIDTLRVDRRYNDDAARKAGVALFTLLGPRHPTTLKRRKSFDLAVF